ncbi:hypothetical protein NDU88_004721 [Pleurodeles waltl]|uniref:Uncharacterized protein n=1 Tax=Pleurodeles waltl TaxID=8319 RepID=A0AAV7TS60_PLEWA|nr:hypothetical protein NDU88_004721 [Pleurodeles waltl]
MEETPETTGLLNSQGSRGKDAVNRGVDVRGAYIVNRGATEEGWADHDAGRRGLHPDVVQRTGRLGGSKMPSTRRGEIEVKMPSIEESTPEEPKPSTEEPRKRDGPTTKRDDEGYTRTWRSRLGNSEAAKC